MNCDDIKWPDCPSIMTNEIAYELAQMNFPNFYSYAIWRPNFEDFKYVHFFKWFYSHVSCGENDNLIAKWSFHGSLDESKFTTVEHKHSYIKGRLASYSVSITKSYISIGWANSYDLRKLTKKWMNEVISSKFGGLRLWTFEESEGLLTFPGTPSLKLIADEDIINFLIK